MTNLSSDRARRRAAWAAPVVVAGVVAAGVAISTAGPSDATPTLKARSAKQLLTAVQTAKVHALEGVVNETAALGLPTLPSSTSRASLTWESFVTGSHNAKVWIDGPAKQRAALLGELSEADVVHNGKDVWTYTSSNNTVTHAVLRTRAAQRKADPTSNYTPAALAAQVLKAIKPSTKVSVDASRYVAKRPAYTLVLRPRDARSTVRKVTIAIDAKTSIPLQVQVFAAAAKPALSVGFTTISYTTPSASTFNFRIPKGATVSTAAPGTTPQRGWHHRSGTRYRGSYAPLRDLHRPYASGLVKRTRVSARPKVIGSGWTSVIELPGGLGNSVLSGSLLRDATSPVGTSGERLLRTALVNMVLTNDGRVFAGAVKPALLEHIAATTR